ncbi:MAG: DNA mismatch repair endonuclease MutL [Fibrobacter sp.]|nr:DNA mismatch repair endonuclease MutL [Fibrobacter sp.]
MQYKNLIEVLPQAVIEKIAAGEVVERPASVLKELIENSIDSGATKIDIFIEDAGFGLIKVVDNGCGMNPSDLPRSILPHATSKIRSADDLFSIATMGFRGEALASIASISRMEIISSSTNDGLGYILRCTGGEVEPLGPHPHLQGTTVVVRDLFFNVPARKKFMKSRRGEQLAMIRLIEQLVLPFPAIHFTFTVDSKKVLDTPFSDSPYARIAEIGGAEFTKKLIFCEGEKEGMEAKIYVSPPESSRERPRFQSLYVNLRRIDNDSVTFAIREAFSQFLGFGYRPSFFCFLDIDPSRIDVNVHPTKQQIKFDNERDLFGFIFSIVKKGINSSMIQTHNPLEAAAPVQPQPRAVLTANNTEEQVSQADFYASLKTPPQEPSFVSEYNDPLSQVNVSEDKKNQTILNFPVMPQNLQKEVDQPKENNIQLSKDVQEMWDLIPCYQIHGLFILAPIKNGILLIDQHAAHERVLYEQALEDIRRGRSASQQLLFPVVLELSLTERAVINSGVQYFTAFGFEISDFGGNALSVSAIPAFLKNGAIEDTIRGIIKYLLEGKDPELFLEPEKRFAAAFACGAAIKAGQKLSQEEMNALLNSLFSTKNPYICPHGRPTLVRMSVEELSRRFLR